MHSFWGKAIGSAGNRPRMNISRHAASVIGQKRSYDDSSTASAMRLLEYGFCGGGDVGGKRAPDRVYGARALRKTCFVVPDVR